MDLDQPVIGHSAVLGIHRVLEHRRSRHPGFVVASLPQSAGHAKCDCFSRFPDIRDLILR